MLSATHDVVLDAIPLIYFSNGTNDSIILEKLKSLNSNSKCYDYNFTLAFQKLVLVKSDAAADNYNIIANDIVVTPTTS